MGNDDASMVVEASGGGDDAASGAGEAGEDDMVVVETSGDGNNTANGAGEDDFDDDFAEALAAVIEASDRRLQLDKIIADCTTLLKQRRLARKGRQGRMRKDEQKIEDALKHKLARAKEGKLPGDPEPAVPQDKELVQSAARHAQDHVRGDVRCDMRATRGVGVWREEREGRNDNMQPIGRPATSPPYPSDRRSGCAAA